MSGALRMQAHRSGCVALPALGICHFILFKLSQRLAIIASQCRGSPPVGRSTAPSQPQAITAVLPQRCMVVASSPSFRVDYLRPLLLAAVIGIAILAATIWIFSAYDRWK